MKVEEKSYVEIEYKLTLSSGEVVDQSTEGEPLGFVFNTNQIIPGLEKELEGKKQGDTFTAVVAPTDGYGERRDELVNEIPRSNFPSDVEIKPGVSFQAVSHHGPVSFVVQSVNDDVVVADFNHPLAGQTLHFDVTVVGVREATEDEIRGATQPHAGCGGGSCSSCGAH